MLYDKDFLLSLDKSRNRFVFARITALSFDESPIETIEGRVTQGSVNLDGASAVRRSCALTIVAQNFNYANYLWGLNTKFKLEIAVGTDLSFAENFVWFNQGIYIITSFNTSRSTTNFTVSLQGKDKMCMLNGEVGGTIGVQTDFGTIEEENKDGVWTIRKIAIPDIIRNMVHAYGGEPYHNIIIKDLDTLGLELLEYRYENIPLILYREANSSIYNNIVFMDDDMTFYYDAELKHPIAIQDIPDEEFEQLVDSFGEQIEPTVFYDQGGTAVCFTKIQYGDTAGYRTTDLTYAGDLIANVGDSITSVLDKIKNMLVEFEYFYDIEGHFVFQKKQSFTQTLWSPTEDGTEEIQDGLLFSETSAYTFSGAELITGFSNNPNLLNLRNDFSIWGQRTSVSGATLPIHLRYAIDIKPTRYTTISLTEFDKEEIVEYNNKYGTTLSAEQTSVTYSTESNYEQQMDYVYVADWREVLYQMAKDYFRYNTLSDFEIRVKEANPEDYPTGRTGYEQYYTDIEVCWRQLYNPELKNSIAALKDDIALLEEELPLVNQEIIGIENSIISMNDQLNSAETQDEVDSLTRQIMKKQKEYNQLKSIRSQKEYSLEQKKEKLEKHSSSIENFYQIEELYGNPSKSYRTMQFSISDTEKISLSTKGGFLVPLDCIDTIYDTEGKEINPKVGDVVYSVPDDNYFLVIAVDTSGVRVDYVNNNRLHWNKDVFTNPGVLNYWFDFLDTEGELSQFNVKTIGSRTKAINESTIKSIYFRETPQVIFVNSTEDIVQMSGFKYIQVPDLDKMFTISAQGKSAKERLDELLYAHSYCSESATITSSPIYYLQPNTRIHISDPETKLVGDYIVSKITIPLTYNGTMQITATKAAQTIFF